jgi:hypothetical protein
MDIKHVIPGHLDNSLALLPRGHTNGLDHLNLERFNDRVERTIRVRHGLTLFLFLNHITIIPPAVFPVFCQKARDKKPVKVTNRSKNPVSSQEIPHTSLNLQKPTSFFLLTFSKYSTLP